MCFGQTDSGMEGQAGLTNGVKWHLDLLSPSAMKVIIQRDGLLSGRHLGLFTTSCGFIIIFMEFVGSRHTMNSI